MLATDTQTQGSHSRGDLERDHANGTDPWGQPCLPVATPKPASDPFIEIPLTTPTAPAACVVELEDRSGSKMTLRLAPTNGVDALVLVEAFWRRTV